MNNLEEKLIEWRRDFHRYPETGFLEIRTASIVASILDNLGFDLRVGKEVMSPDHCMGKPSKEETEAHLQWALENGANKEYIEPFSEGYTGIVATWDTKKEGPTIAFRIDMDALDINESQEDSHFPEIEGFRSTLPYKMHACGHDAHTTIGLGLATLIAENKDSLKGKIRLIFQPAEEGTRGARSMVEANVVDDVDYFIASHVGTGVPDGHFVASKNGFLATSKLDITFKGVASHAGGNPEQGKNALLAAASAALNIYAIPRHSEGATRINVGELHAGSGRNIIADRAFLKVETRGENTAINEFVKSQAEAVIAGSAQMYGVEYEIQTVGEAISAEGSRELASVLHACAEESPYILESVLEDNSPAGSEDATFFIERVQKNGGQATYCVFGTELAAGHHNEKFDINEKTLMSAVHVLFESIKKLN
ncbi:MULTISPECIES: M20 family metallo-hydrolase [unclassified Mesobacillus]|uniref:M20 family metallo-hydrolase n=1 Tax=unclassified Mesobacillus TaxID=2675270 RepID=UPI0020415462|nr:MULTISPECIES: M20 family metallo-hydrolase [unclassified Mesobacillus]MCM3122854.1 M20 family metallo-hydrolase [Mesobacillus sp. MER 33]MCM3233663.1 M20 family metallo-hydrolase [Mesobacillus sp. MER 48]